MLLEGGESFLWKLEALDLKQANTGTICKVPRDFDRRSVEPEDDVKPREEACVKLW